MSSEAGASGQREPIDRREVEAALDDLLEEGEGTLATRRLTRYVDRILALVQPDPRIARIAALGNDYSPYSQQVQAILGPDAAAD